MRESLAGFQVKQSVYRSSTRLAILPIALNRDFAAALRKRAFSLIHLTAQWWIELRFGSFRSPRRPGTVVSRREVRIPGIGKRDEINCLCDLNIGPCCPGSRGGRTDGPRRYG